MAANDARREPRDDQAWDSAEGMLHAPVENPGAVVAVRFTREEFQRLSRAARLAGLRTTRFIHAAALARAAEEPPIEASKSVESA